jgi:hypothetical protein
LSKTSPKAAKPSDAPFVLPSGMTTIIGFAICFE